ncbi:cation:proton antiporter [Streptomyces sp. DSM 110735]|uniref:cation:proton antiporter n=1 Tax=Streptomyces sp. DSM 110735 TaxID=2775031 RepID=UPI0027DB9D05|nr:cation:proton antiporter [Streptomyces sp. DSM 110735]MBJ7903822.1 cation:proton antiporter [Streptomyces sp. DSM 110735]
MRLAAPPIPPLPSHQLFVFLLQAGVLVLLAVLCGRLAARLGMPAVAGELCVGILLGPTVLGNVSPAAAHWLLPRDTGQFHLLDAVGQIGVLLLVGITGVEMDAALVRRRGVTALGVGAGGLLLPFGLGYAAGWAAPASLLPDGADRPVFALFVAVALSVSALPVIAKILTDMHLIHRDVGQLTLAAGMVDDVVGWILLSVVSAMAVGGGMGGDHLVMPLLATALVLTVAFCVLRPLANRVMKAAEHTSDTAVVVGTVTAFVLLCAAATQALGLEAMFGAFLAGMLISSGPRSLRARLAPLRTVVLAVFAPLFFATAGLRLDLSALTHPATLAAGAALLLVAVVGKVAGVFVGARAVGVGTWESVALGGALNARGVIQLVVAAAGLRIGVLNSASYTLIVLVAVITSLMAPPLLRWSMRHIEHTPEEQLRLHDRSVLDWKPADQTPDAHV